MKIKEREKWIGFAKVLHSALPVTSWRSFLLVSCYFFLVACYFLLIARYFLPVARCVLLVACYFLFVSNYFLFVTRDFLLVARHFFFRACYFLLVAHYFLIVICFVFSKILYRISYITTLYNIFGFLERFLSIYVLRMFY